MTGRTVSIGPAEEIDTAFPITPSVGHPAGVDPVAVQARDDAVGALLNYAEVLALRHGSDHETANARGLAVAFAHRILRLPLPHHLKTPAEYGQADQEDGD